MTTNLSANSHTDAPITDGGETNAVPITVTILDAVTIFEGPDSVYRYDLPGTGIVEGWALGQVMDQISKLAGPSWPDVEACVVADSSGTDIAQEATTIVSR
ncbi:MAG: type VII secretion-associated protein, partial [Corynebacterium sp.]|nr:type VII secretion-associated protein [Corynebacterium sp.]